MNSKVYVTVQCPSVCLSQYGPTAAKPQLQVCCCGRAGRRYRSISAAVAGECGQCHVFSIRRQQNTDLIHHKIPQQNNDKCLSIINIHFRWQFQQNNLCWISVRKERTTFGISRTWRKIITRQKLEEKTFYLRDLNGKKNANAGKFVDKKNYSDYVKITQFLTETFYYYYTAFNMPCVGHKDDES